MSMSMENLIEEYIDKVRKPSSKEIRKVYLCKLKKQIKEEDTSSSQYHKFMEWKRKQTNNNDLSEQLKQLQIENNNLKHKIQLLENNSDLSNINIVNNLLTQVNHLINPPKVEEQELEEVKENKNNSLEEVKSIDNKELTEVNKKLTEQLEKEVKLKHIYIDKYVKSEEELDKLRNSLKSKKPTYSSDEDEDCGYYN